jgi:hypothetical protein
MKAILCVMLAVMVVAILLATTSVRVGAYQSVDLRTFVFVRGPNQNIQDADVVMIDEDGHARVFPKTNEGGWTKLQIPDGRYRVTVSADGWKSRTGRLLVPARSRYPHRTFLFYMKKK